MPIGTAKWFNPKKGYGFINPADGEDDIFVHYSVIQADGFKTLEDGERVEYDLEPNNGTRARSVRALDI